MALEYEKTPASRSARFHPENGALSAVSPDVNQAPRWIRA
jgi:hypothetical protein